MARGNFTEESDIDIIDILVVAGDLPSDPREAFGLVQRLADSKLHLVCFNKSVFLKKLKMKAHF